MSKIFWLIQAIFQNSNFMCELNSLGVNKIINRLDLTFSQ